MTTNPSEDAISCPLATILMNASEFKHFVNNVKSTHLQQKLMPVVRVCEGESTLHTDITEEAVKQFVQRSNTRSARSYFSGPIRVASTESNVSSSLNSKESSQEFVLAQELESAIACGIDSTFVEEIQTAKNSVTKPTTSSGQDLLDEQLASAANDNSALVCTLSHESVENNERQESAVVNSNFGGGQLVLSSAIGNQDDKIQAIQPAPLTAQGSDGDILSSQTSQIFFSATSAIFDARAKSSNLASQASLGSIEAHVGSSDDSVHSEPDYLAPWESVDGLTSSIFGTDAIVASEEMALVTEDFVPESEGGVPMGGAEIAVPASVATARASGDIDSIRKLRSAAERMEVVVSSDDSESEEEKSRSRGGRISLMDASLVLMQRNKESSKEEGSSDDELSSDGI